MTVFLIRVSVEMIVLILHYTRGRIKIEEKIKNLTTEMKKDGIVEKTLMIMIMSPIQDSKNGSKLDLQKNNNHLTKTIMMIHHLHNLMINKMITPLITNQVDIREM